MSRSEGLALAAEGKLDAAKRKFAEVGDYYNLSVALAKEKDYDGALKAALRLVSADPVRAYTQAMSVCWEQGDQEGVKRYLNLGLAHGPEDPKLRTALGTYKLARWDWSGWVDVEYREWAQKLRDTCDEFPEWDCKPWLDGMSLLVHYQDGHGDRVMYSRYLKDVLAMNPKRVVMFCSYETTRMFAESFTYVECVSSHEQIGSVDCWVGLTSLGKMHPPNSGKPYLYVPEHRKMEFAGYMREGTNLRVGLVWAGNAKHSQDENRSLPFSAFEPLLDCPGVDFYSLQFEQHNVDHGGKLNELSTYCRDTADTVAAISNLDLVIGVDTGMIHFAGAQGIPAWVLTRTPIDWRWKLQGESTDWYDSVRVFRNKAPKELYQELFDLANRRRDYRQPAPRKPDTKVVDFRYGKIEVFTRDLWISRSLEEYGEFSEGEVELFRNVLTKDSIVVEAGAHFGVHTIPLSQICDKVYAFEPCPPFFNLLDKNLSMNGVTNVLTYKLALGSKAEVAYMNPPDFGFVHNAGGAEVFYKGKVAVDVATIDSFNLRRVDFIKADVEGSEIAVLEGAEETIQRCRPLLYLETATERDDNLPPLIQLLTDIGYRAYSQKIPLFNQNNWRGNQTNVFGMLDSKMILAVPRERFDLRSITNRLVRLRISEK